MEPLHPPKPAPRWEIANVATGDVALCGTFATPDPILPRLDRRRVCFVASLASRADLERILRELLLRADVRHLVLCGDDFQVAGEALLALWRDGLGPDGRLAGGRGVLSAELDATIVDALRARVGIRDLRERTVAEIADTVRALPALPGASDARSLPAPAIPQRKIFPSRKTTFPIFSSDVGDAWLQLLNLAFRVGAEKRAADGERIAEALNAVVTIEPAADAEEFPAFLDFNRDDFQRYYRRFERASSPDGVRRDYGERLHGRGGFDQIDAVCARLKESPDTRSATAVVLGPDDMKVPALAPGLLAATFNAVDGKLFGSFVLREADVYTDWPLEAMALVRLQREVAARVGLAAGTAVFVLHSAHLHERDWGRSLRVLGQFFKRPLPLQVDPSGIFLFGNDNGQARAMLLDHDASDIFWEEAFSDPEDLSWYIVDVMPWLLPQHIRYVGQECAALMRAIKKGEGYEQG